MYGLQPADQDAGGMAFYKNSRNGPPGTDTDGKRRGREGYYAGYQQLLKKGSRRRPRPVRNEQMGEDIQETGMISDLELTAEEMGRIKREHWAVENRLHHVLDDTFRKDRSPAKRSKNNLALFRKFAYNILRIAILFGTCTEIMTEAMDEFSVKNGCFSVFCAP